MDLNGLSQQVAFLSDSTPGSGGSVTNSSATLAALILSATGGAATFSGAIQDGNSQVSLTMAGSGAANPRRRQHLHRQHHDLQRHAATGQRRRNGVASPSSAIVDDGNLTFNRSNAVTQGIDFSGSAISGTGSLTQAGNNTLSLTTQNTYTGGTIVNGGTLALAGYGSSIGTIRGNLTINAGGTVNADDNWAFGIGNGGYSNSCVSTITINGGVLNFTGAPGAGGTSATNITMTGGTISGNAFDWYFGITTTPTLSTNFSSTTAVISSGLNIRVGGNVTFNVTSARTSSGVDLLISEPIGTNGYNEGGGIIKSGAGLLCLSGANTYAGSTTISDGVLQLGNGGTTVRFLPAPQSSTMQT